MADEQVNYDEIFSDGRQRGYQMFATAGGAPKTYTRLYLYPAENVISKSQNVKALFEAYGGFMPIPVSPSELEYSRAADHNEAYGITSGGLLQRNLPKLWRLSIHSYAPKDIWERAFHNRSQDKQWSGVYTQQSFVDYINALMRYKVPFLLYDSSNPERIKHSGELWCIEEFTYKMQPHDDIDYELKLIEWREPRVKVSEMEMRDIGTKTPDTPQKTRKGSGKAIMVFGYTDARAYNHGSIYPPEMTAIFLTSDGRKYGMKNMSAVMNAYSNVLVGVADYSATTTYGTYNILYSQSVGAGKGNVNIPVTVQIITPGENAKKSMLNEIASHIKRTMLNQMLASAEIKHQTIVIGGKVSYETSTDTRSTIDNALTTPQYATDAQTDVAWTHRYGGSRLDRNAWCRKLETRTNVSKYELHVKTPKASLTLLLTQTITFSVSLSETGVVFPVMYKVQPLKGNSPDKLYDAKQTWLTPKENTIETSYKHYLSTLNSEYAVSKDVDTKLSAEATQWSTTMDKNAYDTYLASLQKEAVDTPIVNTDNESTVVPPPIHGGIVNPTLTEVRAWESKYGQKYPYPHTSKYRPWE